MSDDDGERKHLKRARSQAEVIRTIVAVLNMLIALTTLIVVLSR